MATVAIPEFCGMRVQAETPEPPVREPARTPQIAPVGGNADLVGKERYTEKFNSFGVRPIPSGS
jgi:hypothetical protein